MAHLRFFDSARQAKVPFEPLVPGKLGVYVCGPTVYGFVHLGNARTFTAFDVLIRFLRSQDFQVQYVRNVTDVDDKIIRTAQVVGRWDDGGEDLVIDLDGRAARAGSEGTWWLDGNELHVRTASLAVYTVVAGELVNAAGSTLARKSPALVAGTVARHFEDCFLADVDRLGLVRPDESPRVSDTMPEIVAFIERLVAGGHAYSVDGDVYFSVASHPPYLTLSKRNLDDLLSGARVEVDARKRAPVDFALWKKAKPGEPAWESPWGPGRPGWHIECSAMSMKFLGERFDIHGGGMDLLFPHHENELAQSWAANGQPMCSVWTHAGFLDFGGAKMSKSLGNVTRLRDALDRYDGEVLRYFLVSTHYRAPLSFLEKSLFDAESRVTYFYETVRRADARAPRGTPAAASKVADKELSSFVRALSDDLNVPEALSILGALLNQLNAATRAPVGEVAALRDAALRMGKMVGLLEATPDEWLTRQRSRLVARYGIEVAAVEKLIADRTTARGAKDFARADELRASALKLGVELLDGPQGTDWKVLSAAEPGPS